MQARTAHFGSVHQYGPYYLNGLMIESIESQKDLGILFDNQLKFHSHTTEVAAKANRLLGLIRRSFDHLDLDILTNLFVTLMHPTLEYCNSAWGYPLILTKGRLKMFSVELREYYCQLETSLMGRDS